MALIFTALAACQPEPPVANPCPELDWSVHLHSTIYDEVYQAIPLPDGDVVVVGNNGGAVQIGTDGTKLMPAYGARDAFVARLSSAGVVRWSHVIGGFGADRVGSASLSKGGLWFGMRAAGYDILLDWEPLTGTGVGVDDPTGSSAFYLGFDLDGTLLGHRRVSPETGQFGRAAAIDSAGNQYVIGSFATAMTIGSWTHSPTEEATTRAFVASFDPAGTPRWFTSMGGHAYNEPAGMVLFDDHLLAVVDFSDRDNTLQHGGTPPEPWTPGTMGLVSLDLNTGLLTGSPDQESLYGSDSREFEPGPDGTAIVTGIAKAPGGWSDVDGNWHELRTYPGWTGVAVFGYRATLDANGRLLAVDWQEHELFGSSATTGSRALAGWQGGAWEGVDGGTIGWTSPILGARDATAGLFTAEGGLECGWKLGGDGEQDAFDAAIDSEGGLWVVGRFSDALEVRDPDGQVILELDVDENESDGFILRFAPPSAP